MIIARANRSRRYPSMRWLLLLTLVGWTAVPPERPRHPAHEAQATAGDSDSEPRISRGPGSGIAKTPCSTPRRAPYASSGGRPHHRARRRRDRLRQRHAGRRPRPVRPRHHQLARRPRFAGHRRSRLPDGFRSHARPLKVDNDWDLAALVIWRPPIEPVQISAAPPQPGDLLTIHGYGHGQYRIATGHCTQFFAPKENFPREMVELDVEARQGDSGGPIFNQRGELAGVLFGAGEGTTIGSFAPRVNLPGVARARYRPSATIRHRSPSPTGPRPMCISVH